MKIVILGSSGLIGHKLFQILSASEHETVGLIHGSKDRFKDIAFLQTPETIGGLDVLDFDRLTTTLADLKPDVVMNCVGITKRKPEIEEPLLAIGVNSMFPHKLAQLAGENSFRVVHFSTDCVFNGLLGNYNEKSITTGEDAYGQTKALGEIRYPHTLTIRSSFIGRELAGRTELLEWLISQDGKTIKGFTKAMYSGVSTHCMSRVVLDIIENHPEISHLHQLSTSQPISKYDLLCLARDAFELNIEITPDDSFEIQPTLDSTKLRDAIDVKVPSWEEMMAEIAADPTY